MLAFNLGVFFKNLAGSEVVFTAKNKHCEITFTGGVSEMIEQTELIRRLTVILRKGEVSCRIGFDDDDGSEEEGDEALVEVRLIHSPEGEEVDLMQSEFKFDEITLKPLVQAEAEAEEQAAKDGTSEDGAAEDSGFENDGEHPKPEPM